tara:strand:+ start:2837 stop:3037 length:201 start_codon:yes stop_codon:yes gene_type:complete
MAKKQKRITDIADRMDSVYSGVDRAIKYEIDSLNSVIKKLLKDNSQKEKMIQKLKRKLNGKATSYN